MNDCKNGDCGCGCCEGTEVLTPQSVANRPGLEALSYRAGTHAAFLETMKARLSSKEYPALRALTTRQEDDPSIAMLDAGATMLDVLTFYQERIANEGYLRTATERRSILELARLVGYKLRPGVAASVYLAFTLENGYQTEIPAGTRAQSIPAPGELPQAFETSDPFQARAEWNELKPRMTRPTYITLSNVSDLETIYFVGTSTNLNPNDPLLFVFGTEGNAQILHRVESVKAKLTDDYTVVTLQSALRVNAAILDTILNIVDKYLELDAYHVSAETQMANRVTEFLMEFKQQIVSGLTSSRLIFLIKKLLPDLREEHAIAVEGEYERLEPWVGSMIEELEEFEASLETDVSSRAGFRTLDESTTSAEIGKSHLAGLSRLIAPLLLPPSSQPRNTYRLVRNYQSLFSAQADLLPRLLTAFQPKLKNMLYQAWANTRVTPDTELESVNAMRVKTAPFGHNAPLRVIQDEQGVIVGQEEWPLIDARRLDIRITYSSALEAARSINTLAEEGDSSRTIFGASAIAQQTLFQIQATNMFGGHIYMKTVPLSPTNFLLGDLKVTIIDDEDKKSLRITYTELKSGKLLREITVSQVNELALEISFDDESVSLPLGDVIQTVLSNQHRVTLATGVQRSVELLSIRDEFSPEAQNILTLDAEYYEIKPSSWVAIQREDEDAPRIFQVAEVKSVSLSAYGISGKATELTLRGDWLEPTDWTVNILKNTTVFAQSDPLELAKRPITKDIFADTIELDTLYDGLESGRWVVVTGERTDIPETTGVEATELVMLAGVTQGVSQVDLNNGRVIDLPGDKTHTTITLANSLAYTYKRDTVKIYGNVVKATHGETRNEVLGSGDGSKAMQTFALKQSPLTYTSAPTISGIDSSLEVRINDVRWPEMDSLIWLSGNERGYITKTDNEDKTSIIFGDGKHGVRLPTGLENVKAVYRSGIGKPGNVAAKQISLLATKPLGVKSVINPLPASGGADRENRDQARRNVPLAVAALDRLVSVQDYADFVRTFAGIGKASAVELPDGRRMLVHVTIAGAEDIPIDTNSDLFHNLKQALYQFGDPYQPVQVSVRELMLLVISANVRILPDYQWESVEPRIRAALLDAFGFDRCELGQDVMLSEVISIIQGVPGVAYVDVDIFDSVPETIQPEELENLAETFEGPEQPKPRIPVTLAWVDSHAGTSEGRIRAAQLAYLSPEIPDTLILSEKT